MLHGLRLAGIAQCLRQFTPLVAIGAGELHLDQFVGPQGRIEFRGQGVGHPALADPNDRLAVMSTGTKKESLVTREHRDGSGVKGGASLTHVHREAVAAIKRELAAIVLFGIAFTWAVFHWTEGLEESVLLGGYGVGAALWIRIRVYGLLRSHRSAGARAGEEDHGSQQE